MVDRRRLATSVTIPMAEVREGCALLISRISSHSKDAERLLKSSSRRGAFLPVLCGMEEVGKLFQLVEAAAAAEVEGKVNVTVEGFRDHSDKALKGSGYIERVVILFASALKALDIPHDDLGRYADHLSFVGADLPPKWRPR